MVAGCGRVGFDAIEGGAPDAGDASADVGPQANLILHYTFDDDPSDGADDAVGGHPAACDTLCPQSDLGHLDGGFLFNGADEALVIADAPDLRPTSITVATWLFGVTSSGGTIAAKSYGNGGRESWQLSVTTQGALEICTRTDESTQRCDAMGNVPPAECHHVAYVQDGSVHRSYLDGIRLLEAPVSPRYDGGSLTIGVDLDGEQATGYLRGILDDLRIYDGALSDAEIAGLAAD